MIMDHAPGVLLIDIGGNPLAVFKRAAMFGDAHVALHRLPVEGCPLPSEGFLVDRQLTHLREMIEQSGLSGLEEPFAWLEANKGAVIPEEVSLCHNDFHPLNIILGEDDRLTVVDWSGASLGDRHQDIANTLVVVGTAPNPLEGRNMAERLATRYGRGLFLWLYLRRYRRQLPIDPRRVRYWEALVSFAWWAQLESFKSAGSAASGLKPDTVDRVPPGHLERLQRYFLQRARP
jgi:aminoglycoside phosphotransferase (APT) family kinase protein